MRFLVDESADSHILRSTLESLEHDVIAVRDLERGSDDEQVLAMAFADNRALITKDKDFGRLVFESGLPHRGVIRISDRDASSVVAAVLDVIKNYEDAIEDGSFVTVDNNGVRITPGPR